MMSNSIRFSLVGAQVGWTIAVCVLASVLLGWSEEQKDAAQGVPWASNFFLYLAAILLWGVCDGLSAYMGRDLHLLWVVALTGAGFAAAFAVFFAAGFAIVFFALALGARAATALVFFTGFFMGIQLLLLDWAISASSARS